MLKITLIITAAKFKPSVLKIFYSSLPTEQIQWHGKDEALSTAPGTL